MFRHKIFVTSDELDLSDDALRYIKALNASIPAENREIWVTIEEMVDRLVHCGALPFLKVEHVSQANLRFKSVAPLEQRRQQFGGERHIYFRPEEFTEGAPLDQRGVDGLRCPAYLPQRNYFRSRGSADAKMMLATLNDELRRVGKIEKGIEEGRIECELIPAAFAKVRASSSDISYAVSRRSTP